MQDTINSSECSICLECLTTDDTILQCKHQFHKVCINLWKKTADTCPYCRAIIKDDYADIYMQMVGRVLCELYLLLFFGLYCRVLLICVLYSVN